MKEGDVRKFVDGYAAARQAGDLDAIESHFALPLILASKSGTTFIEDEDAFDEALTAETAGGNPTGVDYTVTPLPDGAARIQARWTLPDGAVRDEAYTLAEDDDGVIAIVAIEADG